MYIARQFDGRGSGHVRHWRAVSIIVALLAVAGPDELTQAATDLAPDLGMARITDVHLNRTSTGRRLLRFSTTIVNVGVGPFELRGRWSAVDQRWVVAQQVTDTAGDTRSVETAASLTFGGDGHGHWHVSDLLAADLVRLDNGSKVGTSAKLGFCFWDNATYRLSLPGAPGAPVYGAAGCGTATSTVVTMGLSVGWGDTYPYTLPDQYIDITSLTPGRYRLNVVADARRLFFEQSESNNGTWVDLQIKANGAPRILGYGPAA
jgi:hypothetical protein